MKQWLPGARRRRPIARVSLALGGLVLGAALAACGGSESSSSDGNDTLRFGSYGPPIRSWDPHRDGRQASNLMLFAVYDRLLGVEPDGTLVPQLAEEWEFVDETTLELRLREGVTFQDGTAFDAEAVKANIERAQTIDDGTGPWAGPLGVIENVEVVNPAVVRLNLSGPSASVPALLADAAGAMISPAAFGSDLNQQPAGAGMYELIDWTPDGSASFEAFDGYWDPDVVGPAKLEMPFQIDQLRRFDMFKAGELDATFGHTSFVDRAKREGTEVDPQVGVNFWFMNFNRSNAPFDDRRVRLAINHALDRQALIDAVLFGEADENHQPFNDKSVGFNDELGKTPYETDPNLSRQLLEEAGYADGIEFDCAIVASSGGAYAAYLEVIKDQLAQAGITMNIKLLESQSAALLIDKTVDCAMMPYGAASPIVVAKQLFAPDGYYNAGKEADDETVALLAALEEPQSDEELSADFDALMEKVIDDGLYTGIFFENWAVVSNENVEGLEFYSTGQYTEFRGVTVK